MHKLENKPTASDLLNSTIFSLDEKIVLKDPTPFFKNYLNRVSFWSIFLYVLIFVFGIVFIISLSFKSITGIFAVAPFFVMLALLPIHEMIHAFFYKIFGAKNIGFKIILRQGMVYTYADKDVVSSTEMKIIASAPLVLISGILLLIILFDLETELTTFASFCGIFHCLISMGDIAILNYLELNKKKLIYAFDDHDKGESYFFSKK